MNWGQLVLSVGVFVMVVYFFVRWVWDNYVDFVRRE